MKKFKRIYIEITNCCNLSCSFCPPSRRRQAFMSTSEFETVLQKLKGHGDFVYLHIKGEPMLHPEFKEILDLCAFYGVKVNLTTNGTLIRNHQETLLQATALRQVSVSLQSQENLENETVFKQYMEDVLRLVESGKKDTDIIFEWRLWNYEETITGSETGKNQIALAMIQTQLEVTRESIDAIPQGKGTKLTDQVYLSKSLEFQWPDMSLDVIGTQGTCYGLRQQVGILVNGDVVPCCLDGEGIITLGNIFEQEFEDIVTSNRAYAISEGFENRQIIEPLCMRCGYRERF